MNSFEKFTLRFAVYGVIVGYLACDLFVFHGPLHRRLDARRLDSEATRADAHTRHVAAFVFGREITLEQIDHAVRVNLAARHGDAQTLEDLPPAQLRLNRYAALGDLIDHEILRVKVMHSTSELTVAAHDIDAAFTRIASRFADESEFHAALADAGLTTDDVRARAAARLQQVKFAESRIDPLASPATPLARHQAAESFRTAQRDAESARNRVLIHHAVLDPQPQPHE